LSTLSFTGRAEYGGGEDDEWEDGIYSFGYYTQQPPPALQLFGSGATSVLLTFSFGFPSDNAGHACCVDTRAALGVKMHHVYDMGTSTFCKLEVIGEVAGVANAPVPTAEFVRMHYCRYFWILICVCYYLVAHLIAGGACIR
jgi:hypothetical protein